MKKFVIVLLSILIFASCAKEKKTLYNWRGYSKALYNYKDEDNMKTYKKYRKTLEKLINSKKVPPGIYCEYGLILAKDGDSSTAVEMFNKEAELYPESATFVNLFLKKLKKDGGKNDKN